MSISTRKAGKLRGYVLRKRELKRELDAYLTEREAAIAASSDKWVPNA